MAELNDPHFHALKVRAKIHAMGTTYLCHPANRVQRISRAPRVAPPFRWKDPTVLGIDRGAGDDLCAVTFVTPGNGLTASLRMGDDGTFGVCFPKSQFSSDAIAKQMIADALGLFRAPGFNGRRYLK